MTDEKVRHCLNCVFHSEQNMLDGAGKPVIGQKMYLCKRFPPSPILVPASGGLQMIAAFPPVSKDVSCHEHTFPLEAENDDDALIPYSPPSYETLKKKN